jgi:hypothetical protein
MRLKEMETSNAITPISIPTNTPPPSHIPTPITKPAEPKETITTRRAPPNRELELEKQMLAKEQDLLQRELQLLQKEKELMEREKQLLSRSNSDSDSLSNSSKDMEFF